MIKFKLHYNCIPIKNSNPKPLFPATDPSADKSVFLPFYSAPLFRTQWLNGQTYYNKMPMLKHKGIANRIWKERSGISTPRKNSSFL